MNIQRRQCFVLATLLDPRFKNKFLQDFKKAESMLVEEMIKNHLENSTEIVIDKPVPSIQPSIEITAHDDIWQCFDDIANGSSSESDGSFGHEVETVSNFERQGSDRSKKRTQNFKLEVEKYVNMPLLPRQESSLLWWKQNGSEFPNLGKLAIKYLCPPPSSVESERLFSAASSVYTENRNRLAPENAEKLLFIMKNMKIVNFKY